MIVGIAKDLIEKLISFEEALNEGEVIDVAGAKKETEKVVIDHVVILWAEGESEDTLPINKELSYEEAQTALNDADYLVAIKPDNNGWYDKCNVEVTYTIDGKQDKVEMHIDLGDGLRHGVDCIDIKTNFINRLKTALGHDVEIEGGFVEYDKAKFEQKYGTKEQAVDKYIADHTVELPKFPNYTQKTIDEIAEGDIFVSENQFFKVVKRTPTTVKLAAIDNKIIKVPTKVNGNYGAVVEEIRYSIPVIDREIECPRWILVDTDKAFKLKSFTQGDKCVMASQGRHDIHTWTGSALNLDESVAKVAKGSTINESQVEEGYFIQQMVYFTKEDIDSDICEYLIKKNYIVETDYGVTEFNKDSYELALVEIETFADDDRKRADGSVITKEDIKEGLAGLSKLFDNGKLDIALLVND